jgi:hypothetical protein
MSDDEAIDNLLDDIDTINDLSKFDSLNLGHNLRAVAERRRKRQNRPRLDPANVATVFSAVLEVSAKASSPV